MTLQDSTSVRSRLISGLLWLGATKVVGQAITWGITLAVVRLLSPQDYGLMGIGLLFTSFLLLFHELGLGAAIVQRPELTTESVSEVRWALLAVNVSLCAVLTLLAPLLAAYFAEPAVVGILRILSLTFIINAFGVPSACLLQREMLFRRKSQAELTGSLAGAVVTLVFALMGFGVWSLVVGYLLQQLVTNSLYCVFRPVPFARAFSLERVKPFVNFGFQVASSKVLWYFSSNADFLVVGRLLGAVQLGYYTLAFHFSALPIDKVVSIVTQVALPSFAALRDEEQRLARYYLKLVGTVALITFPMFLGLFVLAEDAVTIFLTSKWTPVVVPLKILCFVSCLRAIETMNTPLLLAKGRPGVPLLNNVLQAIVLPICFVIGAQWSLNGVAVAWLIAWPVLFAVVTRQTLRIAHVTWWSYLTALRHPVAGAILMVIVVMLLRPAVTTFISPVPGLFVLCFVGAATYMGYQASFNGAAVRELVAIVRPGRASSVPAVAVQGI